ncbi:SgcJ/EcaC family oxidoreductase [Rudaea sp.]|uniref:YybH family protein n=1 Tax=Rudaea sp. TaxID=2136325 RepID=UPI00321FBE3D
MLPAIRLSTDLFRSATLRALCLAPLLSVAAAQTHTKASSVRDDDLADARRAILAVNADWIVAMRARDAHRAALAYAEDAVFVTREGRVLSGRVEIEKAVAARTMQGTTLVDGALQDDGLQRAGALVYEWGHSSLKWRTAEGGIQSTEGHFLTVWKRAPDAHWQIIRNLTL